jgi:5-methyltetrahydropteroyltriglutamate--homocysteine methyltransferase
MAMVFAKLLNEEARELAQIGVDVIQLDEPAFNAYMDEAADWGSENRVGTARMMSRVPAVR